MIKQALEKVLTYNLKHIDAVFVYKGSLPVAYKFASYIPDNPDTFYQFNSQIEKVLPFVERLEEDKLYHYKITIDKKQIYLFVYRINTDTYIFVFSDSLDLELGTIIYENIIKPLKDYLASL
ncbi:hypothetical protein GWK41_01310 [Persephonella atlantica]|uniref:Roadblock/LAMTOR2 domain-containing protein n=1 Tax=Persephonella atlantica TaxID=2699429 RepID=A0ABS1GFV5_9AQUI|nr:hypothetical protein [Persephonella atlantica]MBK3331701.1 hypothetical protein [Persephonella atlantica]